MGSSNSPSQEDTQKDPLIGRVLLGRYEVKQRIGAGGMGAVYVARQLAVDREVALKVLRTDLLTSEQARERFRREAAIIGRLRHPNTIQLIDYGETDDGLLVMVTELLVGQVLSERLKTRGHLSIAETVAIGRQIASSLEEAHRLGLVHRDLKPANVFLVEVAHQVHAKVLDFGIARLLDEEATRITSTGQVFGTPRYMAPEQGVASAEADHRADLYSLALILFECLAGQPPFVAQTSLQYMSAHMSMPPPKLREHHRAAPPELENLIDTCLRKNPAERVQSAAEIERILRDIELHLEVPRGRVSAPPQATGQPTDPDPRVSATLPSISNVGIETKDEPPLIPQDRRRTGRAGLAVALSVLFAIGVAIALAKMRSPPEIITVAAVEPSGHGAGTFIQDTGEAPWDATSPDIIDSKEDAALVADVGAEAPDATVLVRADDRDAGLPKKKSTHPPRASDPLIGGKAEPRTMWIPIPQESDTPAAMAAKCKASELGGGTARLTLKRCPNRCAVLVEGTCAGRTPFIDRQVPEGNKSVTVICKNVIRIDAIAQLRSGETSVLSCR